jgi:hypothetical protein
MIRRDFLTLLGGAAAARLQRVAKAFQGQMSSARRFVFLPTVYVLGKFDLHGTRARDLTVPPRARVDVHLSEVGLNRLQDEREPFADGFTELFALFSRPTDEDLHLAECPLN